MLTGKTPGLSGTMQRMAAMNNFPAMTEEQRQLTGLCKIEIKRWQAASESNPNMRYMVELMEMALAQLTAPPAQVLKPIELPGKGGVEATSERSIRDWSDGWAAYREEAIKAIRAAGYEVKE